jgi:hypothetical protein
MLRNEQSLVASNDREIDALALFPSEWPSARAANPIDELSLFAAERLTSPTSQHVDRAGDRRAAERRKAWYWFAQLCALLVRLDGEHEQLRKLTANLDTARSSVRWRRWR